MDYINNMKMVCSHMQIENLGEKFRDVWARRTYEIRKLIDSNTVYDASARVKIKHFPHYQSISPWSCVVVRRTARWPTGAHPHPKILDPTPSFSTCAKAGQSFLWEEHPNLGMPASSFLVMTLWGFRFPYPLHFLLFIFWSKHHSKQLCYSSYFFWWTIWITIILKKVLSRTNCFSAPCESSWMDAVINIEACWFIQ